MRNKSNDFKNKEVINLHDGKRLGFVNDVEIDYVSGQVTSIVVPSPGLFSGFFSSRSDYIIPWSQIKKVGDDIIMVDHDFGR